MTLAWNQTRRLRSVVIVAVFFAFGMVCLFGGDGAVGQDSDQSRILEDFRHPDQDGFPEGWEGSRSTITAKDAYTVHKENGRDFLKGKGANQRAFTRNIVWNPKKHPLLTWRWRVHSIPDNTEIIAAIFVNLDVDFFGIPVSTKYVWSTTKSKGTISDGGFFRPAEVVVRSGRQPLGEWVEETVNVYEEFKEIHQHEPADHAWGISLQSGSGVEIDFGPLEVHPQ